MKILFLRKPVTPYSQLRDYVTELSDTIPEAFSGPCQAEANVATGDLASRCSCCKAAGNAMYVLECSC